MSERINLGELDEGLWQDLKDTTKAVLQRGLRTLKKWAMGDEADAERRHMAQAELKKWEDKQVEYKKKIEAAQKKIEQIAKENDIPVVQAEEENQGIMDSIADWWETTAQSFGDFLDRTIPNLKASAGEEEKPRSGRRVYGESLEESVWSMLKAVWDKRKASQMAEEARDIYDYLKGKIPEGEFAKIKEESDRRAEQLAKDLGAKEEDGHYSLEGSLFSEEMGKKVGTVRSYADSLLSYLRTQKEKWEKRIKTQEAAEIDFPLSESFLDVLGDLREFIQRIFSRTMEQAEQAIDSGSDVQELLVKAKDAVANFPGGVAEGVSDIPSWFWEKYCSMLDSMGGKGWVDRKWEQQKLAISRKYPTANVSGDAVEFRTEDGMKSVSRVSLRTKWYLLFTLFMLAGAASSIAVVRPMLQAFLKKFCDFVGNIYWEIFGKAHTDGFWDFSYTKWVSGSRVSENVLPERYSYFHRMIGLDSPRLLVCPLSPPPMPLQEGVLQFFPELSKIWGKVWSVVHSLINSLTGRTVEDEMEIAKRKADQYAQAGLHEASKKVITPEMLDIGTNMADEMMEAEVGSEDQNQRAVNCLIMAARAGDDALDEIVATALLAAERIDLAENPLARNTIKSAFIYQVLHRIILAKDKEGKITKKMVKSFLNGTAEKDVQKLIDGMDAANVYADQRLTTDVKHWLRNIGIEMPNRLTSDHAVFSTFRPLFRRGGTAAFLYFLNTDYMLEFVLQSFALEEDDFALPSILSSALALVDQKRKRYFGAIYIGEPFVDQVDIPLDLPGGFVAAEQDTIDTLFPTHQALSDTARAGTTMYLGMQVVFDPSGGVYNFKPGASKLDLGVAARVDIALNQGECPACGGKLVGSKDKKNCPHCDINVQRF
jgi:hypothetical protein